MRARIAILSLLLLEPILLTACGPSKSVREGVARTFAELDTDYAAGDYQALVNLFDFHGLRHFPGLRKMVAKGIERNRDFERGIDAAKSRAAFGKYLSQHLKIHPRAVEQRRLHPASPIDAGPAP